MSVPFVIGDLDNAFYLKPEMGELFILGGLDATEPIDPDVAGMSASTDEIIEIGERASRRLSPIEDCQPVGGWAGLYDVSPDWQPVIGEVEEDVFVDAGTSGHGFKLAPALGEEVARLVLGASHSVGIKQFHPDRFATGRLIQGSFSNAPIIG